MTINVTDNQTPKIHSMTNEEKDLLDEWENLREEVARKQDFGQQLILSTVAGSFAIFSFALRDLSMLNAFLALLPIIIITFAYYWILKDSYSAMRITKYLREYIEPKTKLHWETWLQMFREEQRIRREEEPKKRQISVDIVYDPIYHAFYGVSLLICISIIWAQGNIGMAHIARASIDNRLLYLGAAMILVIVWYICARYFIRARREDMTRLHERHSPARIAETMHDHYDSFFHEICDRFDSNPCSEAKTLSPNKIETLHAEFHQLCQELSDYLAKLPIADERSAPSQKSVQTLESQEEVPDSTLAANP